MNFGLISKVLGVLLLIVGSGMAICAAFALVASGWQTDGDEFYALGMGAGITLAVAIVLVAIGLRSTNTILRRDAAIAVGLGWILAAVFGGLPYLFSEPRLEWDEAFFEAMSGFTTTGSTVMQDIEAFPPAILLWRSLTQWMGGIGIVVLYVAVLSFLGVGAPPTQPSLGTLIRIGQGFLFSGEWWILLFPSLTLLALALAVNLLGDWLRDALNPKLR